MKTELLYVASIVLTLLTLKHIRKIILCQLRKFPDILQQTVSYMIRNPVIVTLPVRHLLDK